MNAQPLQISGPTGDLSADLLRPSAPRAVVVLAHGAGAGYRHATLVGIGEALAGVGIASLRFNFPFMEAGRRRVDGRPQSVAAIVGAAAAAAERCSGLPLLLGGHSFGGRMVSHALAEGAVAARAMVCLSFPLHPAGRPGIGRAAHLGAIDVPMLFLSGTRDALAESTLLRGVVDDLGSRARLHWLEDADHGYRVRKRVRQDRRPVFEEIATEVDAFVEALG
ncbi:MAG: hypothetical protein RIC56_08025 [Pseudomonadales bacterium]